MTPHFEWTCSYQNTVSYKVHDDTGSYEIEERRPFGLACDEAYCRRTYNGDSEQFDREVVGAIGTVHRKYSGDVIPPATLEAFNAWRLAEHEKAKAKLRAAPDRYGSEDGPNGWANIIKAPAVVKRAVWRTGTGWIIDRDPTPEENARADALYKAEREGRITFRQLSKTRAGDPLPA